MKKVLLSCFLLSAFVSANAQCSDLMISEYVEGSGNNKALEIYNASTSPISLAGYRLIRWDNGSVIADQPGQVESQLDLPSNIILQPHDVYVIALDLTDPAGTGQTAPIDPALQAVADTLLCPGCAPQGTPRVLCFNGDDALSLQKNVSGSWVNIDIFACIGERPSNSSGTYSPTAGWSDMAPYSSLPPGYTTAQYGPYYKRNWTLDHTLQRKAAITNGITTNPAPETFNPSVEWDSLPQNTFTGLGVHNCNCNAIGIKNVSKTANVLNVYPNPAATFIKIQSSVPAKSVVIYDVLGQEVKRFSFDQMLNETSLNIADLPKGQYVLTVIDGKENKTSKSLVIQ